MLYFRSLLTVKYSINNKNTNYTKYDEISFNIIITWIHVIQNLKKNNFVKTTAAILIQFFLHNTDLAANNSKCTISCFERYSLYLCIEKYLTPKSCYNLYNMITVIDILFKIICIFQLSNLVIKV